jgi:hypothetical protein
VTSNEFQHQRECVPPIRNGPHKSKNLILYIAVLWIRNFSLRIRIRLFIEFRIRIRILLVKNSGFGTDLFPDEIPMILKALKWRFKT